MTQGGGIGAAGKEGFAVNTTAKEFRDFILRGNVVDLAVGVIIGGAFGGIVTALVKDIITPFIGMFGKMDLSNLNTTINGAKFGFGDFLNVVISFVIIAFVVFFFIVKPVNHLMSLRKTETPVGPDHAGMPSVPEQHPRSRRAAVPSARPKSARCKNWNPPRLPQREAGRVPICADLC